MRTVRVSTSLTDAAMAKISQGTKLLIEGGHERLFQQTFQILPGEKLLHAFACHLSTTSGPVIGTLYISTQRIAFCSDYPLSYYPFPGRQEYIYYKVFAFTFFFPSNAAFWYLPNINNSPIFSTQRDIFLSFLSPEKG